MINNILFALSIMNELLKFNFKFFYIYRVVLVVVIVVVYNYNYILCFFMRLINEK